LETTVSKYRILSSSMNVPATDSNTRQKAEHASKPREETIVCQNNSSMQSLELHILLKVRYSSVSEELSTLPTLLGIGNRPWSSHDSRWLPSRTVHHPKEITEGTREYKGERGGSQRKHMRLHWYKMALWVGRIVL
jgi:hypothetical protein